MHKRADSLRETDKSALAQTLCNQIFRKAFSDEISLEVENLAQLERYSTQQLLQLRSQLCVAIPASYRLLSCLS
ncbi:hypothetical protein H6F61_21650 [Cyanobacteria bacterium FACHB-472]|nr:hypothetical protein [Cyanobacteria bacterium FACHB-472]